MSKEYVDPSTYKFYNLNYKTLTDDMQLNIQLDKKAKAIGDENERGYEAMKTQDEEAMTGQTVRSSSEYIGTKKRSIPMAYDVPFGYEHLAIKRAEEVKKRMKHPAHRFGGLSKKRVSSKRKSNKNKKRTIRRNRR